MTQRGERRHLYAVLTAGCAVLCAAFELSAQTPANCEALRDTGKRTEARACYTKLAASTDAYLRAEGLFGLRRYQDANDAFRAAAAAQPKNALVRVRWGRLYLENFQPADAAQLFNEALEIQPDDPPALLGLAQVAADGFSHKAAELAAKVLQLDPKMTAARSLLAYLALEDNNPKAAGEQARKALAVDPGALDALSVLVSIDLLDDRKQSPWLEKIFARNPAYGEVYDTAGHFFVINRRYQEGIAAYRKALELDPELWKARAELGVNLMRLGRHEEARKDLEACFNAGYKSPSTVNSLRLLDSFKNFEHVKTPHGVLMLNRKEAGILTPYFTAELERCIATYTKKYGTALAGPVSIEVYPDHEDFAVRTMGMPGLGALGVTFEDVVAMDSPSARPPGSFHWASTLWHEMSHVYVIQMTHSRVPRWFTEGLAVHEETQASPEWGDRMTPDILMAVKEKKLLPVAELDRGFIHPQSPSQVVVSYFQAGKICDYIQERWGWDTLLAMVRSFGELQSTPDVIEAHLKMKPEAFDTAFLAWLDKNIGKTVAGFDAWQKQYRALVPLYKAKNYDAVIAQGAAVRDLYPDYVEAGSVYEMLAEAYLAQGDKTKARDELDQYVHAGGRDPVLLKKLAKLWQEGGDAARAAAVLERLNDIYPVKDGEYHATLGGLYLDLNKPREAVREYQAVLASAPVDPAAAHYQLAVAYQKDGQPKQAEEHVFLALEAAPGYRAAQKLLLELNRDKQEAERK